MLTFTNNIVHTEWDTDCSINGFIYAPITDGKLIWVTGWCTEFFATVATRHYFSGNCDTTATKMRSWQALLITRPLPILSIAFLKLTASSRLSAPPNGSPKCLRFGHRLILCIGIAIPGSRIPAAFLNPESRDCRCPNPGISGLKIIC